MQVWRFDHYGSPAVLTRETRPVPAPGADELLIKVVASAINPSDVKNVSGHFKSALPRVPGRDFAGVVVGGARDGEEVWGSGPGFGVTRDGAHAEYIVLPAEVVGRKPSHLSMAEASAIGVPYLAAWCALVVEGRLEAGETVLVTGVSGAVGRAATQIAHWKQARVIGASQSLDNPSGADAMIDTTSRDLVEAAHELTAGRGVDLVLDSVGGTLFEPCLRSLRPGGRQIAIASNTPVVSFNLVDFYHAQAHLAGVDTMKLTGREIAAAMDALRAGFDAGALQPPAVRTWPFARAVDAYEVVARGGAPMKHVLLMD